MKKRKIFKIIIIIILVPIVLALLFFAYFFGSIKWNKYSKKRDAVIYQKEVCDTITTINGNFELKFNGFSKKDLSQIHFFAKKNNLISSDTVINFKPADDFETQTVLMPFKKLNINDQLVIYVGKRYYVFSNYQYNAYYNYGMFGPVGPCQCGATGFQILNGETAGSGWLIKKFGLVDYQMLNE